MPPTEPSDSQGNDTLSKLGIALVIVLIVAVAGFLIYRSGNQEPAPVIDSYDSCVAAGNYVTESDPPTCWLTDGKSFVKPGAGRASQ